MLTNFSTLILGPSLSSTHLLKLKNKQPKIKDQNTNTSLKARLLSSTAMDSEAQMKSEIERLTGAVLVAEGIIIIISP